MLDPRYHVEVSTQPDDRADRGGSEDEAVGKTAGQLRQRPCEQRRDRDAGEVVVCERRMADVRRHEHLVLLLAREETLAVGEMAVGKTAVDADLVDLVLQLEQGVVAETEAPGLTVVGGPVRDPVGLLGDREQVLSQLGKGHSRIDGSAVPDDVQVAGREIDHASPVPILDVGVPDVPFLRHRPVERLCTGRNLVLLQRNDLRDPSERLADAVAGDRPADRVEVGDEPVELLADLRTDRGGVDTGGIHRSLEDQLPAVERLSLPGRRVRLHAAHPEQ